MEDNVTYATVVIKDGKQPPKAKTEEPSIYASVKTKQDATTSSGGAGAGNPCGRVLVSCLVLLSLILLGSIGILIYFQLLMNNQKTNITNLEAEVERLSDLNFIQERANSDLKGATDRLNWTFNVILTYEIFPVKMFCQGHTCKPCKANWIEFHNKCYLFYEEPFPWKTWGDSRKNCQERDADLVVIDTLREQEFISNHTKFYYDEFHGYWMGLRRNSEKQWVWLDGRNDTLGFWVEENNGASEAFGLMIPDREPTRGWKQARQGFLNKFICESVALLKTDDEWN